MEAIELLELDIGNRIQIYSRSKKELVDGVIVKHTEDNFSGITRLYTEIKLNSGEFISIPSMRIVKKVKENDTTSI